MTDRIILKKHAELSGEVTHLPTSKSLSNRALLINAMTGNKVTPESLSSARDTQLMQVLLHTPDEVIHAMDAGTVVRFLTAYFAVTGQIKVMTGTPRMLERPIKNLVDALRSLGAEIEYGGREGFLPLKLRGFKATQKNSIAIRAGISSQFISALMLVAPSLPNGLTIHLEGKVTSRSYIVMTAELMAHFGIRPEVGDESIKVPPGNYRPRAYRVEPDWSAASYWFAFVALAEKADILLPGAQSTSLQGDRVIVEIMHPLGVQADFMKTGLRLTKRAKALDHLEWNFSNCPDLAQTVLPVCAALGLSGKFTGLESLRVKETDRILALQKELAKVHTELSEQSGVWTLVPGNSPADFAKLSIDTYHDHRMAMGFAPWGTLTDLDIENPDVVKKSYPGFWEDMKLLGFGES